MSDDSGASTPDDSGTSAPADTVAANPDRPSWRDWRNRLIPRTTKSAVAVVLAFSIGASLSGVALYSYYEYRLGQNERRVNNYIATFDNRYRTATQTIDAEKQNAQAAVQRELDPLRQFQAEGGTLSTLVEKVGESVWFVETQDEDGAPSVGSAFVVESNDEQSILVGSFSTVKAATRAPGPQITLSKGNERLTARLDNWVEDKDLAVMTIPKGNVQKLEWVEGNPRVGERTFAASGLGATGASVTQGFISDVTQTAIQHDAPVGVSFRGGPLLNSDGRVTGVTSQNYAPFGFASPSSVSFADPIRTACERLLRCPGGNNDSSSPGSRP